MHKNIIVALIFVVLLSGCATYHITTESLLEQFAGVSQQTKVNMLIAPPFVCFPGVVKGNSLREITVLDKNGREHTLPVTNHTSVKITRKEGKKTTFYFDTLLLKDSTITGNKTHFIKSNIKPIYFADITGIELQAH